MKIRERIKEFRRIKASELLPNPRNWRVHPETQRNAMMGALAEVGNTSALLAFETADGVMLFDGHLRAELLGDQEVWVGLTDLTPEEGMKALFEHDQIGSMATVNLENYGHLLQHVEFRNEHLRQMALDHATKYEVFLGDVRDRMGGDDGPGPDGEGPAGGSDGPGHIDTAKDDDDKEVPDEVALGLRDKWGTAKGQLWGIPSRTGAGQHLIYCGRADLPKDVAQLFQDGSKADFVFTSPPYNVGILYASHDDTERPWEQYEEMLVAVVRNCIDHMGDGRALGWNVGASPKTAPHRQVLMLESLGLTLHRHFIWKKTGIPCPTWFNTAQRRCARYITPNFVHEFVYLMSKGKLEPGGEVDFDEVLRDDVFVINQSLTTDVPNAEPGENTARGKNDGLNANHNRKAHPAVFPTALPVAFIRHMAAPGEVVFDPFLGSGTTIVASEKLGRLGRGTEMEPKYVAVALERLANLGLTPALLEE